jgi:pimeloyl-ACP methyl ester carboxylesterase
MRSEGSRPVGYDDRGSGAAVVLLHPFPLARDTWDGFGSALAARRRVIALDAPGFGETPLAGPWSIADLADDLAALLTALGVARATVLGISLGGYAALAFADRHRDRLAGLVLADTRAAADSAETRAARAAAIALIRRDGPEAYLTASLPRPLAPDAPAAALAEVRARAETRAASLIAGLEALRDRPDRTAELPAIACPTLVVCGELDQVTPADEMRRMADAIAGARFVTIAGAGHLAHVEAPRAFARAVTAFLEVPDLVVAAAEGRPS